MFFNLLLVFVDDKNGVGNTDDNNQRRDQSGENSNLISKESNKPKSPNDSDAHHQQCDKSGSVRFEKQKENKKTFLLFVREQAKDENGRTMGFVNFGPVDFVKYEGSQPMNITWKLKHPMPSYLWHETAKLAIG